MRKNENLKILTFLFLILMAGCSAYSVETTPYTISADFVMEEDSDAYQICGAEVTFFNWSEKEVTEFEVNFYLFDSDGEPAREYWNLVTFDIVKTLQAGETCSLTLSLDTYMTSVPQELLSIDYLFVSKIIYSDGSVWEDPYGMAAFM